MMPGHSSTGHSSVRPGARRESPLHAPALGRTRTQGAERPRPRFRGSLARTALTRADGRHRARFWTRGPRSPPCQGHGAVRPRPRAKRRDGLPTRALPIHAAAEPRSVGVETSFRSQRMRPGEAGYQGTLTVPRAPHVGAAMIPASRWRAPVGMEDVRGELAGTPSSVVSALPVAAPWMRPVPTRSRSKA
jgi:hypothetical protein